MRGRAQTGRAEGRTRTGALSARYGTSRPTNAPPGVPREQSRKDRWSSSSRSERRSETRLDAFRACGLGQEPPHAPRRRCDSSRTRCDPAHRPGRRDTAQGPAPQFQGQEAVRRSRKGRSSAWLPPVNGFVFSYGAFERSVHVQDLTPEPACSGTDVRTTVPVLYPGPSVRDRT